MAIEIELTPRKLERIVFIVIILIFMSTTIYYSYKYSQCTGNKTNNITGDAVVVEENTTVEEVTNTTEETDTGAQETGTAEKEVSGNVEITLSPIRYQIKESASFRKAVIDTLSFIVYNDRSSELQMKVKVYHSNSKTSAEYNNNTRVTLEFPSIGAGEHKTKSFFNVQGLNLYDIDLDQNLKFVFEDNNGNEIETVTKVLKIE
jgi:hypothetical protein